MQKVVQNSLEDLYYKLLCYRDKLLQSLFLVPHKMLSIRRTLRVNLLGVHYAIARTEKFVDAYFC